MNSFNDFLSRERVKLFTSNNYLVYVDITGDLNAGLLLARIIYWYLPNQKGESKLRIKRDGFNWIAKANSDWYKETGLTEWKVPRALDILEDKGLIEKRIFKFNGAPTIHIRIIEENFLSAYLKQVDDQFGNESFPRLEVNDQRGNEGITRIEDVYDSNGNEEMARMEGGNELNEIKSYPGIENNDLNGNESYLGEVNDQDENKGITKIETGKRLDSLTMINLKDLQAFKELKDLISTNVEIVSTFVEDDFVQMDDFDFENFEGNNPTTDERPATTEDEKLPDSVPRRSRVPSSKTLSKPAKLGKPNNSDHYRFYLALCEVTDNNPALQSAKVHGMSKKLMKAGYSIQDLKDFTSYWQRDWRFIKDRRAPTPEELYTDIEKSAKLYRESVQETLTEQQLKDMFVDGIIPEFLRQEFAND